MGSSFGRLFRVSTWGESHGGTVGCVVDGVPPGLALDVEGIQRQLDRRRPGQSRLVTQRQESDRVQIGSGLQDGVTLGTPVALWVTNNDARPGAYENLQGLQRPSHADFTYQMKYGIRAASGGGRASARETVARVAAGAIARQVLAAHGVQIIAWVEQVGGHRIPDGAVDEATLAEASVDADPTRCPHPATAAAATARIEELRSAGDTTGGIVRCVVRGVPPGWGEPVFDKLTAALGGAMMSLPAARGFEIGSGFGGVPWTGSRHNDPFVPGNPHPTTTTNHSGGVQGGISNGMPIRFAVAFKPVSTIFTEQDTVTVDGEATTVRAKGRHDPCVVPRAVPIVEAMAALVLVDAMLVQQARVHATG